MRFYLIYQAKTERPKSAIFIRKKSDIDIHNKIERSSNHSLDISNDFGSDNNDNMIYNDDNYENYGSDYKKITHDGNYSNYNKNENNDDNNRNNLTNDNNNGDANNNDSNYSNKRNNHVVDKTRTSQNDTSIDDDMEALLKDIKARAFDPAVLF